MTVSRVAHNPTTTKRQPANRGPQGYGEAGKRLDLNGKKLPAAMKTRKKRA